VSPDPLSVPALVAVITAVFAGTAGEAGANAWNSLVSLVRRTFGPGSEEDLEDLEDLVEDVPDASSVETLARQLAARALTDNAFADALRSWAVSALPVSGGEGSVTNTVSGEARVDGGLVQARDISGPITFGGTSG
jgi:hypothetical protein